MNTKMSSLVVPYFCCIQVINELKPNRASNSADVSELNCKVIKQICFD
jgi:hypothetical protein